MTRSPSSPSSGPRVNRFQLLLLGGGLALAATMGKSFRGISQPNVLDELVVARSGRVFSPRLSIPLGYRRCTTRPRRPDDTVPREGCGAVNPLPLDVDAFADSGESSDPRTLRVSALLALTEPDRTEPVLDTAISRLSRALRLASDSVPFLVDLSGAHLARAQVTQDPHDLLEGLNYALEALGSAPSDSAALFNTALALEWLGLDEQAIHAWTEYLRVDSTTDWAREARLRQRALQPRQTMHSPGPASSVKAVRGFATSHPQEAMLLGWDTVLGRWGEAWEAGKTAEAAALLQLADRLGATLAARDGGDASLADAVAAIRAVAGDSAATRVLARAHRRYGAVQRLYVEHETRDAAKDSLARVLSDRPPSRTLMLWSKAFQAAMLVYDGKYPRAESAYAALLPRIDTVRYPALAGRAQWMRGTASGRNKRLIEAREFYQIAARLLERAGETEYAAYALAQYGEAAYYQRDTAAAYPAMHRGLMALREYRSSRWLHNTLLVLANSATADRMPLAAERIRDEDLSVAQRLPSSSVRAEALLGLANIRAVTARRPQAAEDLASAAAIVARMGPSKQRPDFEASVQSLRVLVTRDSASVAGLDSAVEHFRNTKATVGLLPALLRRADVRLERGRLLAAAADLDEATAGIQALSNDQKLAYLRVAVMEGARSRVDQLVMLHVHAGDTVAALRMLERGRVSFATGSSGRAPPPLAAPRGQVAVEYALIGDTLLTWTVVGNDVRLHRQTLDRGGFLRTIDRVDVALASPKRAASAGADLQRLYDLLVRPVENRLGVSGTPLVIVADGEVAGVPFATLRDAARHRYLVEDHASRLVASLADAAPLAPAADRSARRPLLVADPQFDGKRYRTLVRLGNAQTEVDSLAAAYPGSRKLTGSDATRLAFMRYAPRASFIHYAGHAVFDDARPEQSALILAGADTTGRLTAEMVNGLRLRGVRLVVLSACSTLHSREGRSGGLSGFSGALLGAGAGGVVGSLWQVDDALTQPFMLAFHHAYRETGDPAAALRSAQLEMLRRHDPALSSPAVWGSFRYMGR